MTLPDFRLGNENLSSAGQQTITLPGLVLWNSALLTPSCFFFFTLRSFLILIMASSKQSIHKKCFLPLFLREVESYEPSVLSIILSEFFSVYVSFLSVLALLKPRDSFTYLPSAINFL